MALGVLALIFAFIALISPATVMRIPEVLLSISISVMFNGFGRLFQGALAKGQGKLFRLVSLGLGTLSVGAAIFVSNSLAHLWNCFSYSRPVSGSINSRISYDSFRDFWKGFARTNSWEERNEMK